MSTSIPFNRPYLTGREIEYISEALTSGHTSGDGPFTKRCANLLEEKFSAGSVLLTTSCTSALEMCAMLIDCDPGDEIILPSYTFASSASAFVMHGFRPRFVDVRQDTKNLDENLIEGAINDRTRAILAVHYAGVGCDMTRIRDIADKHGLVVVEDAAQAVNAKFDGAYLGTLGDLGAYSFHESKNFSSGEGGALVVNTGKYADRAEVLREKGTNRSSFLRGDIDKYTWVDIGSSYLPSDILAAGLLAQLEAMDAITQRRGAIFTRYMERLASLADDGYLELPVIPANCEPNYHLFYVLTPDLGTRTSLIEYLRSRGIVAYFHYVPLHVSPMGRQLSRDDNPSLPVTENISDRLCRLPLFCDLADDEVEAVCDAVADYFSG